MFGSCVVTWSVMNWLIGGCCPLKGWSVIGGLIIYTPKTFVYIFHLNFVSAGRDFYNYIIKAIVLNKENSISKLLL